MNIEKIAKKIMSRSQITMHVRIDDNVGFVEISESIYLNSFTYNYKGLRHDVYDFITDVNNELTKVGLKSITDEDVLFDVSQESGLFKFVYRDKIFVDDATIEKLRLNEWVID